ncbi:hypothetical protein CDL15_Pgr022643 [Punica granatum]|uniref:Uncharacterized protein n=1 Tax=Punica granatum TaxID=22663 RepID=A0A218XSM8_PUNGR|nr:hypothetical protein CDL15_Pgr022643 [Punica granatum]
MAEWYMASWNDAVPKVIFLSCLAFSSVKHPGANRACPKEVSSYVKDVVTCMVLDDLTAKPMSTISSISLLTKFNIQDLGILEEREINVRVNEAVKLLKASLQSKRVLTDAFLRNKKK